MPSAWRLTKTKFVGDPLSGDGARLYGGRWNSPGVSVLYFAESVSLAVLEVFVYLEATRILESYLKVPSTIIPFEHILLLNPAHPDRGSISVAEPFPFASIRGF